MTNSNKHKVIRRLGEGPTCEVFVGRVLGGLSRDVTIKRLTEKSSQQASVRDAFYQSADRWSMLLHDGLVNLHGVDRGEHCISYDVHALSAQRAIEGGGRHASEVIGWMRDAFAGLQHCHSKGYLHFNLKPTNVLMNEGGRARLIDGACIEWQADKVLPLPTAKRKYLAPEMLEPDFGRVGPGTDIYCLALTFLEVLFGTGFDAMFIGASSVAIDADRNWLRWHVDPERRLPALDQHADRVPAGLRPVFERALQKSPSQRYLDCAEVLADLARAEEPPASAAAPKQVAAAPAAAPPNAKATDRSPEEPPRLDDLPAKPEAPIILRPFGCEGEMIGMNTDCFTLGTIEGVDAPLPAALLDEEEPIKLRFVRAAEGWRVALVEGRNLFINQTLCQENAALRAGDVLRFVPGGPGVQFTLVHDKAEALVRIAARHAPRLLRGKADKAAKKAAGPAAPGRPAERPQQPAAPPRPAAPAMPPTAAPTPPPSPPPTPPVAAPAAPARPAPAPGRPKPAGNDKKTAKKSEKRKATPEESRKNWFYLIGGLLILAGVVALLPPFDSPNDEPPSEDGPATAQSVENVAPGVNDAAAEEPDGADPPEAAEEEPAQQDAQP